MFNLPLSHINAYFELDGKQYQVERFNINFSQPSDFKGQPQHEIKGGLLNITIPQLADDNLYLWAKKANLLKSGQVLFQTDLGISVLRINFTNAYCVNLSRVIDSRTGSETTIVIAPEIITMNGVEHDNKWA